MDEFVGAVEEDGRARHERAIAPVGFALKGKNALAPFLGGSFIKLGQYLSFCPIHWLLPSDVAQGGQNVGSTGGAVGHVLAGLLAGFVDKQGDVDDGFVHRLGDVAVDASLEKLAVVGRDKNISVLEQTHFGQRIVQAAEFGIGIGYVAVVFQPVLVELGLGPLLGKVVDGLGGGCPIVLEQLGEFGTGAIGFVGGQAVAIGEKRPWHLPHLPHQPIYCIFQPKRVVAFGERRETRRELCPIELLDLFSSHTPPHLIRQREKERTGEPLIAGQNHVLAEHGGVDVAVK